MNFEGKEENAGKIGVVDANANANPLQKQRTLRPLRSIDISSDHTEKVLHTVKNANEKEK